MAEKIVKDSQGLAKELVNDTISRQAAIVAVCKSECESGFCGVPCPEVDALKALTSAQPKQPEIIRCRECKWHRFDKDNIPYCYNIDYGYGWKDDDFCSRAERREVSE